MLESLTPEQQEKLEFNLWVLQMERDQKVQAKANQSSNSSNKFKKIQTKSLTNQKFSV